MAVSSLRGGLTDEVSQLLECTVCKEILFPPIFMCLRGHSICKVCKSKPTQCWVCKSNISDTRNYVAENLITSSNHVCRYKKHGCPIIQKGDLMEDHMNNCRYKSLKCPFYMLNDCLMTSMEMSDVKLHVRYTHKFHDYSLSIPTNLSGHSEDSKMSDSIRFGEIFEFNGKTFIGTKIQRKSKLIWYICLIVTEEEAKKYRGQITIESIDPDRYSTEKGCNISWILPMNSIMNQTDEDDTFETGIFKAYYDWDELVNKFD